MPKIQNLPKLGVNMTEAVITEWVVKEGDAVKEGDLILNAETDKASQEIYATESGVIYKILIKDGETALCQKPIAILLEPGEKPDGDTVLNAVTAKGAVSAPEAAPAPTVSEAMKATEALTAKTGRIRISPLAKKTAGLMGIDFHTVDPAQPGYRIVKADVLAHAEKARKAMPAQNATQQVSAVPAFKTTGYVGDNEIVKIIPMTGIRKIIAERMTESGMTKPSAALTLHADATKLIEWRENLKKNGRQVSYNDLLVYISARALKQFPEINSVMAEDGIHVLKDVNIGVAVDTEKGLMVPVVRNADSKGVAEIGDDLRGLAERVKNGKAAVEDLTSGTFTITNLGMYEIENFTPVLNPPECCILAVGAIVRQPVAAQDSDRIEIRPRMQLTLAFDHRMTDGAPAAKFLQRIKHLIEWPLDLMI